MLASSLDSHGSWWATRSLVAKTDLSTVRSKSKRSERGARLRSRQQAPLDGLRGLQGEDDLLEREGGARKAHVGQGDRGTALEGDPDRGGGEPLVVVELGEEVVPRLRRGAQREYGSLVRLGEGVDEALDEGAVGQMAEEVLVGH